MSDLVKPSAYFECQKCGECCKGYGGTFVNDRDVENISRHIGVDPDVFLSRYCDRSGSRPLIRTAESSYCIFWDELCTIHEVKPRMCKIWPFIDSLLVDPSNWAVIKSMCPGVLDNGDLQDLVECVKSVLVDHDNGNGAR